MSSLLTIFSNLNFKISKSLALLSLLILMAVSVGAHAGAALWSSTNIQYLNGSGYELGPEDRGIMTLEHANAWKYGDTFFFVDITNPDRNGTGFYSEVSPRLSLYKMFGDGTSDAFIKDVLLTFTGEFATVGRTSLYGLALDLNLPKFAFFKTNFYMRDEISNDDEGYQVTLAWLLPFELGSVPMAFEGFFDYAGGLDNKEDNIVSAPRLLVDVGSFWGAKGMLQAGVEYQLWRNKFGVDGVDEDVPQVMVKWIF